MERIVQLQDYLSSTPLWCTLLVGSSSLLIVWWHTQWKQLDDRGIVFVKPRLMSFDTYGLRRYLVDDAYPEFAKRELLDKNRKTIGLFRLATPCIVTIDPKLIQAIFTTHFHHFNSRNPRHGSMGAGVFGDMLNFLDDMPKWKRQRATLSAAFSTKQLNNMIPMIDNVLDTLISSLRAMDKTPISLRLLGSKYAVDAFTSSAFSTLVTEDGEDIRDFDQNALVKSMLKLLNPTAKFAIPMLVPKGGEVFDACGFTIFDRKSQNYFHDFAQSLIDQRLANGDSNRDLLSIMLQNKITNEEAMTMTKGLTNAEIICQTFIFFLAGYETTATTITAAMWQLLKNPMYIDKIRQEATKLQTAVDCGSLSDKNIPWTTAIINETLRLVPPLGTHIRVAKELTDEIEVEGVKFRPGDNVEVPVDLLHTHPAYWQPRAAEFYPERFIEQPDLAKSWFYLPFGGGPRNCIGMRLAMIEIKLGLLRIIANFDFKWSDGSDAKIVRKPTTLLDWSRTMNVIFESI